MRPTVGYVIPDEPSPSRWSQSVVTPLTTLLGFMLGGSVFGLSWMAWNGWAMGSATRRRELWMAVLALIATACVYLLCVVLLTTRVVPRAATEYLLLGIRCVPLYAAYRIYLLQSRSFELHRYFGGTVFQRGWVVVLMLAYARDQLAFADGEGWLRAVFRL